MTPLAATAIAVGGSTTAHAAGCVGFGSASITPPSGPVAAGSSVAVKATVHNMLLQAHLQVSGPGLNQQVGKSTFNGDIGDQITVSQPGYFTLAVIGNATGCTYDTSGFSVKEQPSSAKPTPLSTKGRTPVPGIGGIHTPAAAGTFPSGVGGNGGNSYTLKPFNGSSPFSLPSVAPDGSDPALQYPTPDPQVASPPARPLARNVAETTPIKWGQSLAVALVLLLLSAHLGMWSRHQRLVTEGARNARSGKAATRKKSRRAATVAAADASAPTGGETTGGETTGEQGGRTSHRRTYHGRRRRS
jgi:hypothetical protein